MKSKNKVNINANVIKKWCLKGFMVIGFIVVFKIIMNILSCGPYNINIRSNGSNLNANGGHIVNDTLTPLPPLKNETGIPPSIGRLNLHTRGMPLDYQALGTLSYNGIVLPLYGRKTYASSQRYNYFTTSDGNNIIRIPLVSGGKDCMKEQGCTELMDGDSINITELNGNSYVVKIYDNAELQYIP